MRAVGLGSTRHVAGTRGQHTLRGLLAERHTAAARGLVADVRHGGRERGFDGRALGGEQLGQRAAVGGGDGGLHGRRRAGGGGLAGGLVGGGLHQRHHAHGGRCAHARIGHDLRRALVPVGDGVGLRRQVHSGGGGDADGGQRVLEAEVGVHVGSLGFCGVRGWDGCFGSAFGDHDFEVLAGHHQRAGAGAVELRQQRHDVALQRLALRTRQRGKGLVRGAVEIAEDLHPVRG